MNVAITSKLFSYLNKIYTSKNQDKISVTLYQLLKVLDDTGLFSFNWISKVKGLLNSLGMSDLWRNPHFNQEWFKSPIALRLKDQCRPTWSSKINELNICSTYRLFKSDFKIESYLL